MGLATVGKGVRRGKNYFVFLEVMRTRYVAHVLSVTDVEHFYVNVLTVGIDLLETTNFLVAVEQTIQVKSCTDTTGKKDQSANV